MKNHQIFSALFLVEHELKGIMNNRRLLKETVSSVQQIVDLDKQENVRRVKGL